MKNFLLKLFIVSFILWTTHGTSAMSEFLKPCSRLLLAHEQGFTSDARWCRRPGMRPMLGLRISVPSLAWWGREHREFRVQIHLRMRHTLATAIERERYGSCDPGPPLLQCPRSSVLPRSSSMALFQPGADRAHVWQGDAPQRKCLSEMYDDNDRGAA